MNIPKFASYGEYSSNNYGVNALVFTDERGHDYYFSYRTLVAFRGPQGLIVRENVWGPTTGKHLNWIDGGAKNDRYSKSAFNRRMAEQLGDYSDVPRPMGVIA